MLTEKEKTRVIPLRSVGCVILYIGVPEVIKWKNFESIYDQINELSIFQYALYDFWHIDTP